MKDRMKNRLLMPFLASVGLLTLSGAPGAAAQTQVDWLADAQITQGSPNVVNAKATEMGVGFSASSGAMGQNAVMVFPLPNLPAGTYFSTADFSCYYSGKDLSGSNGPNYNGDLYALNLRSSSSVLESDYYMGSADANTAATLIQDNFLTPSLGLSGTMLSTSDTAGTGGDAKLVKWLNTQLDVSAASRAAGNTVFVFLRLNPDVFGTTYTRFKIAAKEYNRNSWYWPKISYATTTRPRFFAPTSFWNSPVTGSALDVDQSDVQKLLNQVTSGSIYWGNTWINTTQYSTPVYIVPPTQPTVAVIDSDDGFMTSVWGQVPWPSTASPAAGSDKHMVIYQPATDTMWEFFGAGGTYPNPTAAHGGRMNTVSTSNGVFPRPYGATATGLPLVGGLITLDEAEHIAANPNYTIPHAIAFSVINSYRDPQYVAPATRADGYSTLTANSIKEGRRFRLPPDFDVETELATKPRLTKAIARAVKKYGMVVRDVSGAVTLYGEDPKTRPNDDPWPAAFTGTNAYAVMSKDYFPWQRLQVVQP